MNHMVAQQRTGRSVESTHDYEHAAAFQAQEAERNLAIVQGEQLLLDKLRDFEARCVSPEKKNTALAEALHKMADAVSGSEFVDPQQGQEITKLLRERLFEEESLTEPAGGKAIRMTDKTRYQLAAMFARAIGTLEKDKFHLDSKAYVHVDELRTRIPRMISLCWKYILPQEDRTRFLQELREIWDTVKPGVRQ